MLKKSNYILIDELSSEEIVNKFKENSNCKNIVVLQSLNKHTILELELTFYKYKITIESNEISAEAKLKKMWLIINVCCYVLSGIFIALDVIYPIVVCVILTILMYIELKDFDEFITSNFKTLNL